MDLSASDAAIYLYDPSSSSKFHDAKLRLAGLFGTRYHYARIRIYEMSLLFHFRIHDKAVFTATNSPALVNNLLSCIDAIKNYFDTLLAIEVTELSSLPCEEWNRLIVAFIILYKLSAGPHEVADWDVALCRSTIDLETYLDAVADRLREASHSLEASSNTSEGLYFVLPDVLRSARASYVAARDTPHLVRPGGRVHMDLSKERIAEEIGRPKAQRRCPATAFWIDRALVLDQQTDWRGIGVTRRPDPATQLATSEKLWEDLLGVAADDVMAEGN